MEDAFEQLKDLTAKLADATLWSLSDADIRAYLDLTHQLEQTLAALRSHLIREADSRGLPAADHAHTTATWLSTRHRLKPGTASNPAQPGNGSS